MFSAYFELLTLFFLLIQKRNIETDILTHVLYAT